MRTDNKALSHQLKMAVVAEDIIAIRSLLKKIEDPFECNLACQAAIKTGNLHILELLLKHADESNFPYLLIAAAGNGYLGMIKFLVEKTDPKAFESMAIQTAAKNGHIECVEFLAPLSDLSTNNHLAIKFAVVERNTDMVCKLMDLYSPDKNEIIQMLKGIPDDDNDSSIFFKSIFEQHLLRKRGNQESVPKKHHMSI